MHSSSPPLGVNQQNLKIKCCHLNSSPCTFQSHGVFRFIATGDWWMLKDKNLKDDNVTAKAFTDK
jgi:hypothetical protein